MRDREDHIMMGVFSGGGCYQHFERGHKACSACAVAMKCEPASRKKAQKTVPLPPSPPPQPQPIEPHPEPEPFDYFIDSFRGKFNVMETRGDKVDTYDVTDEEGEMVMRVYQAADGRIKVMTPSGSQTVGGLESLEDAKKLLDSLL